MLEVLGVPYTGSDVLASALAMDKLKAKELFRLHNVPTPPYYEITRADAAGDLAELHGSFGYPVVVKPRREGSSIGLAKADDLAALGAAVATALDHDDAVLVERFVRGREVSVALLEHGNPGRHRDRPQAELYDYQANYNARMSEYFLPARIPAARMRGVLHLAGRAAARSAHADACRVDLLVTEGMNEYVLEVNIAAGHDADQPSCRRIAAAAGFDFVTLCEAIVERALARTARLRSVPPRTASTRRRRALAVAS
jgi:D-alanine-D-alanine ligase